MPEIFEVVLWCAALATWLMLFFAFVGKGLRSFATSIRRVSKAAFKIKLR